ncbi:MAG TPA: septum formation initiator family protein [Candidatus Gemmiger faecigallinarum]|nr:septum formation initiator family protein [Candidatus Gemmiger faecigallinarum]
MKHHKVLPRWVGPAVIVALCGYLFINVLQCQMTISTKRQELASIQTELSEQQAQNEELSRSLDDDEDAIIERIAREQGYARPNERVFYDIGGK